MKDFTSIDFNLEYARKELREFKKLLEKHEVLSENNLVLPFFKKRQHLSALLGILNINNSKYDLVAHEFQLFGDFSCDLVTGDSETHAFCLVEFEDAKENSIFVKHGTRSRPTWGRRLEQGFGQIVDWLWKLNDQKNTTGCRSLFGDANPNYVAVLVIGRSRFLKGLEVERFHWRKDNIIVESSKILCFTYDEIYDALSKKLRMIDYEDADKVMRVKG